MILSNILATQRSEFATLAKAWLSTGATTFSVWYQGQVLASWPENILKECNVEVNGSEPNYICATIEIAGIDHGELRVSGLGDAFTSPLLHAQAQFIAQLIKQEEDLDALTAELIDKQDQLLALYNLTQSTASNLNLEQTLRILCSEAKRLIKAQGAFIFIQADNNTTIIERDPLLFIEEEKIHAYFSQVQQECADILLDGTDIDNTSDDSDSYIYLTPITIQQEIRAVLGIHLKQSGARITPYLKLARAIADFASAQIDNAFLHQKILEQTRLETELALAAQIQLQLLPQTPPVIPALDLAAFSRPALQVGGDFYDFIDHGNSQLTFVLGDVSGKGMSAAMLMAMTRTVIRSKANVRPIPTPEAILRYSNEIMYQDFTEVGMFCTVFVGQYDPINQTLTYANAGQSPILFCPSHGNAQLMEADGPALGVLPMSISEDCIIPFQPNDVLIMASDGFNEARNTQGDMYGFDQLLHLAECSTRQTASEIAQTFYETVVAFSQGQSQDDDQTLVVVKGESARGQHGG